MSTTRCLLIVCFLFFSTFAAVHAKANSYHRLHGLNRVEALSSINNDFDAKMLGDQPNIDDDELNSSGDGDDEDFNEDDDEDSLPSLFDKQDHRPLDLHNLSTASITSTSTMTTLVHHVPSRRQEVDAKTVELPEDDEDFPIQTGNKRPPSHHLPKPNEGAIEGSGHGPTDVGDDEDDENIFNKPISSTSAPVETSGSGDGSDDEDDDDEDDEDYDGEVPPFAPLTTTSTTTTSTTTSTTTLAPIIKRKKHKKVSISTPEKDIPKPTITKKPSPPPADYDEDDDDDDEETEPEVNNFNDNKFDSLDLDGHSSHISPHLNENNHHHPAPTTPRFDDDDDPVGGDQLGGSNPGHNDLDHDSNTLNNEVSILGQKHSDRPSFFAQPGILAAVIGGAVVGLLCAILLVMFIVYRMRKKDEGSYTLDEPIRSPAYAARGANKDFYA